MVVGSAVAGGGFDDHDTCRTPTHLTTLLQRRPKSSEISMSAVTRKRRTLGMAKIPQLLQIDIVAIG